MKITIELTEQEANGIKKYLKEVDDIEKPNRDDVKQFVQGIISGTIHAPQEAVSSYING